MFEPHRLLLAGSLAASTLLSVVLGVTDPTGTPGYPTRFMIWNLFLAWLPLVFAVLCAMAARHWQAIVCGVLWLAFLPNAPYLVTDLMHLHGSSGQLWRHILQFGFAAWTGTLLGVVSLRVMHLRMARRHGARAGWLMAAAATGLCAVGVVICRFQRWNSWDLVTRPQAVASNTFDWFSSPLSDIRSTGVALSVAAFFALAYLTIVALEGAPLGRSAVRP